MSAAILNGQTTVPDALTVRLDRHDQRKGQTSERQLALITLTVPGTLTIENGSDAVQNNNLRCWAKLGTSGLMHQTR